MNDPFSSTPAPMQDNEPNPAADNEPDNDTDDSVQIPMENFPEGMAIKSGDRITFYVTGAPDDNGQVSGYFMDKADEKGDENKDSSWDNDFRAAMSPRNPNPQS